MVAVLDTDTCPLRVPRNVAFNPLPGTPRSSEVQLEGVCLCNNSTCGLHKDLQLPRLSDCGYGRFCDVSHVGDPGHIYDLNESAADWLEQRHLKTYVSCTQSEKQYCDIR